MEVTAKNGFCDFDKFLRNAVRDVKQDAIRDVAAAEIKRLAVGEKPESGHEWYLLAVDDPTSDQPTLRFATRPVGS